jgi:predicted dithiol-disulfide oxidoreductase (DUF899 family)
MHYTYVWLKSPYSSTAIAHWEMLAMKECCQSNTDEQDVETKVSILESEIKQKRQELVDLLKSAPRYALANYQFADHNGGKVTLLDLFGQRSDLIVIHNMGQRCPSCTMWADGFNGIFDHLQNRAAVVVISNDDVETQKKFKSSRGWRFPMVSAKDTTFFADMGFTHPDGSPWEAEWGKFAPGISTFAKDAKGQIVRIASRTFGPGDDFCTTWHIFDLLADGTKGWEPQFRYA